MSIPHFTVRRTSPPQYCIRVCWQVAYLQHRRKTRSCTYLSRYVLLSAASPLGTAAGFLLLVEGHSHLGEVVWPYWLAIPLENKGRLLSLKSNDDLMRCPPPLGVVDHEGLGMQVLAQQAIACFT
ncbi:hypothetical protein TIFTF001_016364 [Ficus carica]|uniref:Uncharacterized protein n=1 Tax=Ficus carica TaxID=3494 RepID=A0AA88D7D2_FICCA|nr:hypothetical protein TIFTF001_016364 [Ficus carica]